MQVRSPNWRRWLARSAASLAGIAAALALLEIGLRWFADSGPSLFVRDTLVGNRYQPGFDGEPWIEEAGRHVRLRFNRLGFRGPDRDLAKPAGVRRLALLGDSFTVAVAVDEQDTMAARLEDELNRDGESRWQVLNFGVGAYSTAQSLLVWRHFARQFAPDVVVLAFYNGNDLWDNDARLTNFPRPYFRLAAGGGLELEPVSAARAGTSNWLNRHSRLYVWQKDKVAALRNAWRSREDAAPPAAEIHDSAAPPPYPEAWRLTEALIAQLAREVAAAGARFVLVAVPTHEQVVDQYWEEMLRDVGRERAATFRRDHADERLAALAARAGFAFVALAPALRAAPDPRATHFGKGHWNEDGNRIAAEAVHRHLAGLDADGRWSVAGGSGEPR